MTPDSMGLGWLTPLINGGVIGIAAFLAVWYVIRYPSLEKERHIRKQEELKATRDYESERAAAQEQRDAQVREWHGQQVSKLTTSVEKVADAVDRLEARVADLPCRTHMTPVLPGGSCLPRAV